MARSIRVLLPKIQSEENVYFKGHVINAEKGSIIIYFIKYAFEARILQEHNRKEEYIFGYCFKTAMNLEIQKCSNYLIIENKTKLQIQNLVLNGSQINHSEVVLLFYDLDKFQNSETLTCKENIFFNLQQYILKDSNQVSIMTEFEPILEYPSWISCSMLAKQVVNYVNLTGWLIKTLRKREKLSIIQRNLILALMLDIIIGYLVIELIIFDQKELGTYLLGALEKLVNLMYTLLKWLMGAPAGLKLNNAFNKMLGKYFLYHVELWWLFLDICSQQLDMILNIYKYLGYLGLTFQAAIISDMISLATFHSYCIYVYAARLFNIQISGLTALLRLFVGRKYNPLRKSIDSCEYTNQELFVGTVAFTILLLLLPTTIMYYFVFTMFRVFSLIVQYMLAKLINIVQTLPCYVFILWVSRSSKIAGNIYIEENHKQDSTQIVLNVMLLNQSMSDLIRNFKPPVDLIQTIEWTNLVSNVLTGKKII